MGRVERVLGSGTKIALLRVLAELEEEKTGFQLWEKVRGMEGSANSRRPVSEALHELVDAGVVTMRPVAHSRARLYSLNRAHPFIRRGVLPLFQLDTPATQDPVGAIKASLEGQEEAIGIFSAQMESLDSTPGELVVHFVARSSSDEKGASDRLRSAIDFVAKELGREIRLHGYNFQSLRERGADEIFRRQVLEQGVHIAGTSFVRMAEQSY